MAVATVSELRKKTDAAWDNLDRQLQGMEPYMDRADGQGQWTTRQVLSHLLFERGWDPVAVLKTFATTNPPVIDMKAGQADVSGWREFMSLGQFKEALDAQRDALFAYLETLSEADLGRKARIPLFKQFMGTEEIPIPTYVGALFDYHWNDHAGQLAKIRKAMKLPDAR
jgi:hypothetical protein